MIEVYCPEPEVIAQIERLECDARELRRRIEHVRSAEDRRVLNRQLQDINDDIALLRDRLK